MHIEKGYWSVIERSAQELVVPHQFVGHSSGFRRFTLVDRTMGSVHQDVGVCELEPGGSVDFCLHAYEEGIYVLEGEVELLRGHDAIRLMADDYALVPYGASHAYRNTSNKVARWFEVLAPQPKPAGQWQDTFFFHIDWPKEVKSNFADPRIESVGHFRGQNGRLSYAADVQGLTVYLFMAQEFGAQHFFMMRGEFAAGARYGRSDHPLEECFYALSGEIEIEIEGNWFRLQAGDVAWVGVGTVHGWRNKGNSPFHWLETQVPQFPVRHAVRRLSQWDILKTAK